MEFIELHLYYLYVVWHIYFINLLIDINPLQVQTCMISLIYFPYFILFSSSLLGIDQMLSLLFFFPHIYFSSSECTYRSNSMILLK